LPFIERCSVARVHATRWLDLQDVGAEIGQKPSGQLSLRIRKVEYAYAGE
jgi:hypothetical protein